MIRYFSFILFVVPLENVDVNRVAFCDLRLAFFLFVARSLVRMFMRKARGWYAQRTNKMATTNVAERSSA